MSGQAEIVVGGEEPDDVAVLSRGETGPLLRNGESGGGFQSGAAQRRKVGGLTDGAGAPLATLQSPRLQSPRTQLSRVSRGRITCRGDSAR